MIGNLSCVAAAFVWRVRDFVGDSVPIAPRSVVGGSVLPVGVFVIGIGDVVGLVVIGVGDVVGFVDSGKICVPGTAARKLNP